MDIQKMRDQFSLFLISQSSMVLEVDQGITEAGYNFATTNYKEAMGLFKKDPPHIVFIDMEAGSEVSARQLIQEIKDYSPETLVVAIVDRFDSKVESVLIHDYILRPFIRVESFLRVADRACEILYYRFHNEQLKDQIRSTKTGEIELPESVDDFEFDSFQKDFMPEYLERLKSARSFKESAEIFMEEGYKNLQGVPFVFFQSVLANNSFAISMSEGVSLEKVRGVGFDLFSVDEDKRMRLLSKPNELVPLRNLMAEAFEVEHFGAWTIFENDEVAGIFVSLKGCQSELEVMRMGLMSDVLQVVSDNRALRFQMHGARVHEPETGLFNKFHFQESLQKEFSRARRIQQPLALVSMSLEDFDAYRRVLGSEMAKAALSAVAELLRKTSRATDVLADFKRGDFFLLLPHTTQEGASIKAERLRRLIEKTTFAGAERLPAKKLVASFGVSEYPSFCLDAEGLVKTADDALYYIKKQGGNRVCQATVSDGFQADFTL